MTNNSTIDREDLYFKLGEKSALPAPLWKRLLARLFDLFSYSILGVIFATLSYITVINQLKGIVSSGITPLTPDTGADTFFNVFFGSNITFFYSWQIIVGTLITIFSAIFFGYIYPLFLNKKYFGQTIGKKFLGIAPFSLDEEKEWGRNKHSYKVYIKREMFITPVIIFSNVLILIIGFNPETLQMFYNFFALLIPGGGDKGHETFQTAISFITAVRDFNSTYIKGYQGTISIIISLWRSFATIWFLSILLTIAFNPKKRGLQDKFSNVAVIELSTYGELKLLEEVNEDTITPIEEEKLKWKILSVEENKTLIEFNSLEKTSVKDNDLDIEDLIDWDQFEKEKENDLTLKDSSLENEKENNLTSKDSFLDNEKEMKEPIVDETKEENKNQKIVIENAKENDVSKNENVKENEEKELSKDIELKKEATEEIEINEIIFKNK